MLAATASARRVGSVGAALCVSAAALLRIALNPALGDHYPLATFYVAVAVVGWFWGVRPAVLTALLGYVLGDLLFLPPRNGLAGLQLHTLELAAYASICAALIAFVYRIFERQRKLDRAVSAHASAQQALLEKDARFKRYLDAMPDIVYTWKADGSTEYVNPRWAEYTGIESTAEAEVAELVAEEDREMLIELRRQALRDGTPLRTESRLRDRHGRLRWFLSRCVPIRDAAGAISGWIGSSIDIDEEKRAGAALELSERRYRSVSAAFELGMWSADQRGQLTFATPRLLQFLGMTLEELPQRIQSAILGPESEVERSVARVRQCIANGEPWDWECSLLGVDGSVRRVWTRGIPLPRADGGVGTWAGFSLDVTDRYTAQAARDQARQRLEVVTDLMSVGVAQCDRQLKFVWTNPAYARQLGLIPEQIQGRRIEDVLGQEVFERLQPHFARVLAGQSVEYEGREEINGMPSRWIHAVYTPIWERDAAPVGWVAVVSDMTERRALEEQLRDANRQKDQFLATLAHELRNPLAPVRYATRLLRPGVPPGMVADASRMIDRQLEQMARLLDDLLDISRITRGTLEIQHHTIDLRATLQQAVDTARPLAEQVGHQLRLELPANPLAVRGDETRLIQVVGNLINNAIKYTDADGQILVSAADSAGHALVCVRDNGSGISADLLPHVFEMFTQGERGSRTQSGLGIGLALARQIVELHGGRIEAYSEGAGRGSELRVWLPLEKVVPAVKESRTEPTNVTVLGAGNIQVLIADDNVDAADALAQLLQIAGYQTHVAYDGRTALEMAETFKPAVALLDVGLPHLNGREIAQRLRALPWGRSAHLIAITGWGGEDNVRRSQEAGFDQQLTKPVDPDVLLQHMIRLTRGAA
jgi:PAS domain S-box-containing protein